MQRKIDNKGLNINIKRNQTIWSIFNEEDEKKLVGINERNNAPMKPIPEIPKDNITNKRYNTDKNVHKLIVINKNYGKSNSNNYPFAGQPTPIYGQNMTPNQNNNYMPQYPNFNPMNNMPPFPQNNAFTSGFNPMMLFPTFDPSPNTFNRNVFQMNSIHTQGYTSNYMGSRPQENIYVYPNSMNRNNEVVDLCSIQ